MAMDVGTADYSDPNDRRRLRPVHRTPEADARWGGDDDRNSGQEALLARLYARMDEMATSWGQGDESWDEGDFCAHLADMSELWWAIRKIIGGGK